MARVNYVFLVGYVSGIPRVKKASKTGKSGIGIVRLNVFRGNRKAGDEGEHMHLHDSPVLLTKDPEMLETMAQLKPNDIVIAKGVICTMHAKKSSTCPHCGAKNSVDGVQVYIWPIFAKKVQSCDTEDDAVFALSEWREISNNVICVATLVRDPREVKLVPKTTNSRSQALDLTEYQVALNRKYRVRSDPPDMTADYPWVKTYGQNAIDDKERLCKGAEILMDGYLQTRDIKRHTTCAHCGEEYTWPERNMEIVPCGTEYLTGYYTDDIIEKRREELAKEQRQAYLNRRLKSSSGSGAKDPDDADGGNADGY